MIIENLTDDYINDIQLIYPNGETLYLTLYYELQNYGWYFDFKYKDFEVKKQRLVLNDNILYVFRNILDVVISCKSDNNIEPLTIDCFKTGKVYLDVE